MPVPTLGNLKDEGKKANCAVSPHKTFPFRVSAEAVQGRERRGPRGKEKEEGKMPTKSLTLFLSTSALTGVGFV